MASTSGVTETKTDIGNSKSQVRGRLVEVLHARLEKFEATLVQNQTGYFVGKDLTMADIAVFTIMRYLNSGVLDYCPLKLDKFPNLETHRKKISSLKAVEDWYKGERKGDGEELESKGYELVYFSVEGRAEMIRLAFQIGGVEFRDVRLKMDAFKKMKDDGIFPTGRVPVLFIDGEPMAQSMAILRYVSTIVTNLSLYPKEAKAAAAVDCVLCQVDDVWKPIGVSMHPERSGLVFDSEDASENLDDQADRIIRNTNLMVVARVQKIVGESVTKLEARLGAGKAKDEFLCGDTPTIADFLLTATLNMMKESLVPYLDVSTCLNDKQILNGYLDRMMKLTSVASWYKAEHEEFEGSLTGSGLELVYFHIQGLAEPIRLALNHLKIKFTDVRLSRKQFADLKKAGTFPLGQVPVLFQDGDAFAQSLSILRYVARMDKAGTLYPKDPLKAAEVDAWLQDIMDFRSPITSCYGAARYGFVLDHDDNID